MSCTRRRARSLGAVLAAAACAAGCAAAGPGPDVAEPVLIPLAGPAAAPEAEISGLAWAGDTLVLLPEVPDRFAAGDTLGFFTLDGAEIRAWLDGDRTGTLVPRRLPCVAPALTRIVRGFDGLEAVALRDRRCFLTLEAKDDSAMAGYLLAGDYDVREGVVELDLTRVVPIPLGTAIYNVTDEALVVDGERVLAIGEANGANVNPAPRVQVFDRDLAPRGALPFPQVEYRVTDATALDAGRRFWVVNYLFPPDAAWLRPAPDPETARFGAPAWLEPGSCVERLLELEITADDRVVRTATPPLWLRPRADGRCRNWEAVVRLDDRGFLLMTDKHPATLLAFVPRPGRD